MKPSSRHIDFIDYVRGIAILSVFLYHSLTVSYGFSMLSWNRLFRDCAAPASFISLLPLHLGWLGVSIFFVVSGFCIHLSFQQQGREWGGFFIRRFFRLYPAYLAALLLFTVLNVDKAHNLWFQFVRHALLINNFNFQTYYGINASFWTIAIEVQLYLIYPLLLLLVSRYGWKKSLILLAVCEGGIHGWEAVYQTMLGISGYDYPFLFHRMLPALDYVDTPMKDLLAASPFAYWFSWSLGAFAADAYLKKRAMPFTKSSMTLWAFLVLAAYFVRPLDSFIFLFAAVLTTIVVCKYLGGVGPNFRLPDFLRERLRRVGVYSYSIYLLHQPLLELLGRGLSHVLPEGYPLLKFLGCAAFLPVVILLAAACYRWIEVPAIGMGKQLLQRMAARKTIAEKYPVST